MGSGTSCQLCQSLFPLQLAPSEDMVHVLTMCRATRDTRTRIIPELFNLISQHFPSNQILQNPNNKHLTQLILDPTSLNLPIMIRISPNHPALHLVLTQCRHIAFALHKDRTRQMKNLKAKKWIFLLPTLAKDNILEPLVPYNNTYNFRVKISLYDCDANGINWLIDWVLTFEGKKLSI